MIVGRNGSGKSTLILLLANLLKVKNGKIIINKKYDLNNYVFSDVSVLFQDYYLYPLTIKENLYFLKKKKIQWHMNLGTYWHVWIIIFN